jgi:hypothetical protein
MNLDWMYGAVAFIDILGFSAMVSSDSNSLEPRHLAKLQTLIRKVKESSPDLDLRAFSDSITISVPLKSERIAYLLSSVSALQRMLVSEGVLVRGGVAFGKHFADDSLVYSEALINAYILERDKARFPRILVDPNLIDWYFHNIETSTSDAKKVKQLLLTDRDNQIFLNYLNHECIQQHLSTLEKYNIEDATPSVLEKIQWLGQYHNFIAESTSSSHFFSGDMLNGFREIAISP